MISGFFPSLSYNCISLLIVQPMEAHPIIDLQIDCSIDARSTLNILVINGCCHGNQSVIYGPELRRPHRWQKWKQTAENHTFYSNRCHHSLITQLRRLECKNRSQNPEWYLAFENDAQGLRVLGHFHAAWGIHVKVRNSWIRYIVRHLASKSDVAWSLQIFVQNL